MTKKSTYHYLNIQQADGHGGLSVILPAPVLGPEAKTPEAKQANAEKIAEAVQSVRRQDSNHRIKPLHREEVEPAKGDPFAETLKRIKRGREIDI
jgi:hypothetical protein